MLNKSEKLQKSSKLYDILNRKFENSFLICINFFNKHFYRVNFLL